MRKGFTLLEAIVTIGILAVAFALTGVAVTQLIRVQDSAAAVADHESVFHSVDELIGRYISFVSLDTPLLSFKMTGVDSHTVTYVGTEYETPGGSVVSSASYTLEFYAVNEFSTVNRTFTVSTAVISGTLDGYLDKNDWKTVKGIDSLEFSFDDSIDFLTVDVTLSESVSRRFCYVLRT